MINIGKYIETAINWLTENFAPFRRHQCWNRRVHRWVPKHIDVDTFYVTIALLAILAWYKSGKGSQHFYHFRIIADLGMGFWNETMQTLALVLSSTIIALIMGLPWEYGAQTANDVIKFCILSST